MNDVSDTAKPVRVQRRRTRGFNLQSASPNGLPVVYVGRPTRWGNPFRIGDRYRNAVEGGTFTVDRESCIELFETWLKGALAMKPDFLGPLRGKNLACFCAADQLCHADVLLKYANGEG